MNDIHQERILILDFGSQYTQLIARRVREMGVYCEIYSGDSSLNAISTFAPQGIIFSGGPDTVTDDNTLRVDSAIFDCGIPILGICYGMQLMAEQLGGEVEKAEQHEYGFAEVTLAGHSTLLNDIEDNVSPKGESSLHVWMSHGDHVVRIPSGFQIIATTENAPIAAIADEERQFYALQFHPEVTHTTQGGRILGRFIKDICGCSVNWTSKNIIEDAHAHIRELVGSDEVILGLSGGVDSSVVAALLHQVIGEQLTCVFVDHGLLRLNEAEEVLNLFHTHLGMRVIHVNATEQFMGALQGVADPEDKRKIIGREFIKVFETESSKLPKAKWLAQGTIYPDVIESAATKHGKSKVIKSHHNVGGLPDNMKLKLLEPIRELFKDEVRKIGLELGLPHELLYRHPFPGPGLGVRILGEVKMTYADMLREADAIFIDELRTADLYDKVSQAFAVFLPVRAVGVKGDARRYDYVIALRAVETIDFMTARWAHLPYEFLETVANRIMNELPGIARVTYDISSKPPATIEWE